MRKLSTTLALIAVVATLGGAPAAFAQSTDGSIAAPTSGNAAGSASGNSNSNGNHNASQSTDQPGANDNKQSATQGAGAVKCPPADATTTAAANPACPAPAAK
jgi:hypothetical protein